MNDPNLVVEPQIGVILAEKLFCGWAVVFFLIVSVAEGAKIPNAAPGRWGITFS